MTFFNYPKPINKSLFNCEKSDKTLYGLPEDIKFCRSCVISNQRLSMEGKSSEWKSKIRYKT